MSRELLKLNGLFNEEGDEGGGGGAGESRSPVEHVEGGEAQRAATPGFDAAELGRSIAENLRPMMPQQQEREMSREEFQQHTKYFKVTPDKVRQLFGEAEPQVLEQRAAILQEMLDGSATHAISVGGLMSQKIARDINVQYEPVMSEVQHQRTERFIGRVVSSNEAMKGQHEVVRAAINILKSQNFNPRNEDEATKQILGVAERILKAGNPEFSLQNGQSSGGRASMPKPAGGVNGSGGSGGGGGQGKQKKSFMSVFD